jgi:hypothetical protein
LDRLRTGLALAVAAVFLALLLFNLCVPEPTPTCERDARRRW